MELISNAETGPEEQVETALLPSFHEVKLVDSEGSLGVVGVTEPGTDILPRVNDFTIDEFWSSVNGLVDLTPDIFDCFLEDIEKLKMIFAFFEARILVTQGGATLCFLKKFLFLLLIKVVLDIAIPKVSKGQA